MPQDWETKRYTLEDVEVDNTDFNENSHTTDWIQILLSKCNWEIIETIKTKEGQQILAQNQIEDMQGKPFVGRAGDVFDKLLESIGLTREDIYLCNPLGFVKRLHLFLESCRVMTSACSPSLPATCKVCFL